MVLPSTLLRAIFREHPYDFRRMLGAEVTKLRSFWESVFARRRTKEWAAQHPHLKGKTPAELVTSVPCALHSDSGPCSKNSSDYCISFSGILGSGGEKVSKYLVASFIKDANHGYKVA